jgi:ABC-type uncharacterized transport system auxiliary subunit
MKFYPTHSSLPKSLALAMVLLCASSCALTNKADPLNLRYFAPFVPDTAAQAATPRPAAQPLLIRVERVEAVAHLTEAIAYRRTDTELGYYDDLRWTETPNVYLEQALSESLFNDGSFRRGLTEGAYSLDIVLEAFEELKYGPPRVRLVTRLWVGNERFVLRERRLVVEEPIAGNTTASSQAAVVAAFSAALTKTAEKIHREVRAATEVAPLSDTQPTDTQPTDTQPTDSAGLSAL